MRFKEGVQLRGVRGEVVAAFAVADALHREVAGRAAVITSVCDGKHRAGSLHYVGLAFDLRIWHLPDVEKFAAELRARLTDEFDVVVEDDHIHVEYQPK